MVRDNYEHKLNSISEVEVAGSWWCSLYNNSGDYFSNMKKMMEHFKLSEKETIIFTINNTNVMSARIFKHDGKEIDYSSRIRGVSGCGYSNWFWDVTWISDSGYIPQLSCVLLNQHLILNNTNC